MNTPYSCEEFYSELLEHGLIYSTGVDGGYGRGKVFEEILGRFDSLLLRNSASASPEIVTFPPIVARTLIEKVGYMENFPHLSGSISSFTGDDKQARRLRERIQACEHWEDLMTPTECMMTPAACYPVYPILSGTLRPGGRLVTVMNWVYRHEPSAEPTRLQSFRMREFIRAGTPDEVDEFQSEWMERYLTLLLTLKLPMTTDLASDAFFGRTGKMMEASQREQALKIEMLVPVISEANPTAIGSFNRHNDKFSSIFGILSDDGKTAVTACLAFGLERTTLALLKTHGFEPRDWPTDVRALLWPTPP